MSFDWKSYYDISVKLATDNAIGGDAEAKLRSAISRCYFAAHNIAKDRLIRVDYVRTINPTGEAHRQIFDEFKGHPIEALREVATILNRLRIQRGKADYRDNFRGLKKSTELVLLQTKTLIDLIEKHDS